MYTCTYYTGVNINVYIVCTHYVDVISIVCISTGLKTIVFKTLLLLLVGVVYTILITCMLL